MLIVDDVFILSCLDPFFMNEIANGPAMLPVYFLQFFLPTSLLPRNETCETREVM